MSKITKVSGSGVPLVGNDIDTDRIIPARFLRCVTFDGLGEQAFADDRVQSNGTHPFDQPQYQDASILVVNNNFGCGSSREHAPQSLARWGIKGIIGESFAEIFFGNCISIGVPCITLEPEAVKQIQSVVQTDPTLNLEIDLAAGKVSCGDQAYEPQIDDGARQRFLNGTWDSCGQLVQNKSAINKTSAKLPYISWNAS